MMPSYMGVQFDFHVPYSVV